MWAFRAILIALAVVAVVAFAYFNVGSDQKVAVDLVIVKYVDVPLITVVFWAFVVGVIVSVILFVSAFIRQSVELRGSRKRVKGLEHEVSILRNRPIEESVAFIKDKPDTGGPLLEENN
jgi:uncharacterized membrane protein YciS (DUF1049 family)